MPDFLTSQQRSLLMAKIRSRGNKTTELKLLSLLRQEKIVGWRRHAALPGRPDFAFALPKVAIFVDGCFWHGCPTCHRLPKSNRSFWLKKVTLNKNRDIKTRRLLREKGWKILRVWEHQLKIHPTMVLRRIEKLVHLAEKTLISKGRKQNDHLAHKNGKKRRAPHAKRPSIRESR